MRARLIFFGCISSQWIFTCHEQLFQLDDGKKQNTQYFADD